MTDRQQMIINHVDQIRPLILEAERWLWAHPQTGFTEWEANAYLTEKFEELGCVQLKSTQEKEWRGGYFSVPL